MLRSAFASPLLLCAVAILLSHRIASFRIARLPLPRIGGPPSRLQLPGRQSPVCSSASVLALLPSCHWNRRLSRDIALSVFRSFAGSLVRTFARSLVRAPSGVLAAPFAGRCHYRSHFQQALASTLVIVPSPPEIISRDCRRSARVTATTLRKFIMAWSKETKGNCSSHFLPS